RDNAQEKLTTINTRMIATPATRFRLDGPVLSQTRSHPLVAAYRRGWRFTLVTAALCVGASIAHATENGSTAFPNGGEDFLVGAMPPPGWYGIVYLNRYDAHRVDDGAGRPAVAKFDFCVSAATLRLDWVKPAAWLGADRWGTLV